MNLDTIRLLYFESGFNCDLDAVNFFAIPNLTLIYD
jgi:hypothetical protein